MALPVYVGSATTTTASGTSLGLTPHASSLTNDLLVAVISLNGSEVNVVPPANWKHVDRVNATGSAPILVHHIFSKKAVLADLSATHTFTFGTSAAAYGLYTVTGQDATYPFDICSVGVRYASVADAGSITATAVKTQSINCLLMAVGTFLRGGTSFAPPSGMTERSDFGVGAGTGVQQSVATQDAAAKGTTGTKAFTITSAGGAAIAGATLLAIASANNTTQNTLPVAGTATTANGDGLSGVSCNVPASLLARDFLVAQVKYASASAATLTPPAGWTELTRHTSNPSIVIYTRRVDLTEAASYSWSLDVTGTLRIDIDRYRFVDEDQPVHAVRLGPETVGNPILRPIQSWRTNSLILETPVTKYTSGSPTYTAPGTGETTIYNAAVTPVAGQGILSALAHRTAATPAEAAQTTWTCSVGGLLYHSVIMVLGPKAKNTPGGGKPAKGGPPTNARTGTRQEVMAYDIYKDTADVPLMFLMVLASDGTTPATGLSPTVTLSKNGAAFGAPAGAVTELSSGWYKVAANATDSNTYGPLLLHAAVATADNTDVTYFVKTSNTKKNQALTGFTFVMTDSTNHAPATGLTVTATRSLDGAAFGACANAVAEVANGVYKITLAAADLNANTVMLKFTATGADARYIEIVTEP
jgi:hypothetical protein